MQINRITIARMSIFLTSTCIRKIQLVFGSVSWPCSRGQTTLPNSSGLSFTPGGSERRVRSFKFGAKCGSVLVCVDPRCTCRIRPEHNSKMLSFLCVFKLPFDGRLGMRVPLPTSSVQLDGISAFSFGCRHTQNKTRLLRVCINSRWRSTHLSGTNSGTET